MEFWDAPSIAQARSSAVGYAQVWQGTPTASVGALPDLALFALANPRFIGMGFNPCTAIMKPPSRSDGRFSTTTCPF